MTNEEKQKAIDALKISAPIMAVTQEEFNDYIQTLNKIMDWLEQEPRKGYLSIDDVMSVFDDFMCGEVDEDGKEIFLEMLIDKSESEG